MSETYVVELVRFRTPEGATKHLHEFDHGFLGAGPDTQRAASAVTPGLAFLGTGDLERRQFFQYLVHGRFFALVRTIGMHDASDFRLEADAGVLARALVVRMDSPG